jgi:hypothetical protein
MNTCRSVDSREVAGDIIGRGIFWQEAVEDGAGGKVSAHSRRRASEESMGKGSTDVDYCQGLL